MSSNRNECFNNSVNDDGDLHEYLKKLDQEAWLKVNNGLDEVIIAKNKKRSFIKNYNLSEEDTLNLDLLEVTVNKMREEEKSINSTNPKDLLGIKKSPLHLVPPSAIIYLADGFENGAEKYGPYNWREKKVKATIYVAAAMRHLLAWFDGEELAEDSNKHHLAHFLACGAILVDAKETGNLVDDRPIKGPTSKMLKQREKK